MITACSGGGGSSSSGGGGSATPPSNPLIAVTSDNAREVASHAGDALTHIHKINTQSFTRIGEFSSDLSRTTRGCRNAIGEYTYALEDNDGDGTISNGDVVNLGYIDTCEVDHSGDRLDGSLEVQIHRIDSSAGSLLEATVNVLAPGLVYSKGGYTLTLTGSFDVFIYDGGGATIFEAVPTANRALTMEYSGSGDTLWVSDFYYFTDSRPVTPDTRIRRVRFDIELDSANLGGQYECSTPADLLITTDDGPDTGHILCVGANNSSLRMSAQPDVAPNGWFVFEIDENGSGNYVEVELGYLDNNDWSRHGFGYTPDDNIPGGFAGPEEFSVPTVAVLTTPMNIVDAAHSPTSNLLYVATGNRIAVLDDSSLSETASADLPHTPTALALTDEESTLWIGSSDVPEIQPMATSDLSLGAAIEVAQPPPNSYPEQPFVRAIEVVPGTTDSVVVNVAGRRELVAISGGVELPNSLPTTTNRRFAFVDNETIAIPLDVISEDLTFVDYNSSSGLSVQGIVPDILYGTRVGVFSDGEFVFTENGRHFFAADETARGSPPNLTPFNNYGGGAFATSHDGSRLYSVFPTYGLAFSYLRTPLRIAGSFRYPALPNLPLIRLFATDSGLLVVNEDGIDQIPAADLQDNLPSVACNETDASGLLLPGRFFQLDCELTDTVYDSGRNQLIAGVPGSSGTDGNAIIFIDPLTGQVSETLGLGSSPEDLSLSADGHLLYVQSQDASVVTVIDLDNRTIMDRISMGYAEDMGGRRVRTYFPTAVAPSPVDARDFVAALDSGEIAFFVSRTRVQPLGQPAQVGTTNLPPRDLFLSSSGDQVLSFSPYETSLYDASAAGVVFNNSRPDVLDARGISQSGDSLYLADGFAYDFASDDIASLCGVSLGSSGRHAAAPDPSGTHVYYATHGPIGWDFTACEIETGELDKGVPFYSPLGYSAENSMFVLANGLMAIAGKTGIVIFDSPFW